MSFLMRAHINGFVILWNRYPDEILSTQIIGERQYQKAVDPFVSATEELTGKIDYRHVYLNFTDIEVELDGNNVVKTCPAALGPGFAAGTTFGFQQGDTKVVIVFTLSLSTFDAPILLTFFQVRLMGLRSFLGIMGTYFVFRL